MPVLRFFSRSFVVKINIHSDVVASENYDLASHLRWAIDYNLTVTSQDEQCVSAALNLDETMDETSFEDNPFSLDFREAEVITPLSSDDEQEDDLDKCLDDETVMIFPTDDLLTEDLPDKDVVPTMVESDSTSPKSRDETPIFLYSRPDLLESAYQSDNDLLEPRPIAPQGMNLVEKVESSFDDFIFDCLRNVLEERPPKAIETSSDANSKIIPLTPLSVEIVSESETEAPAKMGLRANQLAQWNQRFNELLEFKNQFKHCSVPLNWPVNTSLAHWVKRQRHQYRVKMEGKHSAMTDERQTALEKLGFIWDSHAAVWEERLGELREYRGKHGHCNVPKKYPQNQSLAVWVKCQRRQYKLKSEGRDNNMSPERYSKLIALGFDFTPRSRVSKAAIAIAHKAAA